MEGEVRVAEVFSGAMSHPLMNKAISGAQADRKAKFIVKAVNNHQELFNALNRLFNVIDWSDTSEDVREAYIQAEDAIRDAIKD